MALRVVGRTIFDADVESEAPEIAAVLEAGMRVFHRFLLPGAELLWRLPLPATRRFNAAKRDIDRFLERLVAERAAADGGQPDLVGVLMGLHDDAGGRTLSDAEIRDEAITLMLAGHETTAQALTWSWYLLARNPAARQELQAELREVLGDRPPIPADFERLPYTQAVFREALRLYPPVWALARISTRPYQLGPYAIPERGTIVASQWVVHRRPGYFADLLPGVVGVPLPGPPPAPPAVVGHEPVHRFRDAVAERRAIPPAERLEPRAVHRGSVGRDPAGPRPSGPATRACRDAPGGPPRPPGW